MYKAFLLKYAEIGLKGKNRYLFEDALCERTKDALSRLGEGYEVGKESGRIFVNCPDGFDYEETIRQLQTVFGISGISPVVVFDDIEFEAVKKSVGEYVKNFYGDRKFTFKVEAKRADKSYPVQSPDICRKVGEYLLDNFPNMSVDVHEPDERIWVEIRRKGYVYSQTIEGPHGMPVGTNGKGMLLLSGGIDSPVAGWMVAKRGVTIDAVYFHAPPYTSERAKQKVIDLAKTISVYTGPIKLHIVNFTEIQMYIYENTPHDELTIIMRRYMMRIAEILAKKNKCHGLITGESIGQVASQTMQSLICTNAVCTLPVYRPLIAFDKQDIVDISERIGTYETSVLPYEDCCTIFVAKHPVTKPIVSVIEYSENKIREAVEPMVEKAIRECEIIDIKE